MVSDSEPLWTQNTEWVACPFSRGSSRPRNQTGVSCIAGRFFTSWATREAPILNLCMLYIFTVTNFIHGHPSSQYPWYNSNWFTSYSCFCLPTEESQNMSSRNMPVWDRNDFELKAAQRLKRLPAMRETWVRSLHQEDPLEKEMATHSSILAWRIPWTGEPGGLQSTGSQRVRHDLATSLSLLCLKIGFFKFFLPRLLLGGGVKGIWKEAIHAKLTLIFPVRWSKDQVDLLRLLRDQTARSCQFYTNL